MNLGEKNRKMISSPSANRLEGIATLAQEPNTWKSNLISRDQAVHPTPPPSPHPIALENCGPPPRCSCLLSTTPLHTTPLFAQIPRDCFHCCHRFLVVTCGIVFTYCFCSCSDAGVLKKLSLAGLAD
jgi:hypothetical protein